jgi:uncharacterized protein
MGGNCCDDGFPTPADLSASNRERGMVQISGAPQFVIKVSKYCNLRCDYCYEFFDLADKTRMSIETVRKIFENIGAAADQLSLSHAEFVWHGGEPFLVPAEFYEQVALIQAEVLGDKLKVTNTVQSNLTVLTNRHIALLKSGFFNDLGISFDVYGDQRVDTKGKLRTETVLANLQKLVDHGIGFGAIAVLARNTLDKIDRIYRFFDEMKVEHRILPYYKSAGTAQAARHGLGYDELVGAFKVVFHEWLASERATRVDPIRDYVGFAINHLTGEQCDPYDPFTDERVFIIDVNGDVYNGTEGYQPEFRYGNLVEADLSDIAACEPRRRSNELSRQRVRSVCGQCRYFGACPGAFVATATAEERKLLDARGCPVRELIGYFVDVFERTDLQTFILATHRVGKRPVGHPALIVA